MRMCAPHEDTIAPAPAKPMTSSHPQNATRDAMPTCYRQAAMVFISMCLTWNLATLARTPASVTPDEGGFAAGALQFWRSGTCGVSGWGDHLGFRTDCLLLGRLFCIVQGSVMAVCGISVFAAQLPSLVVGAILVLLTYRLARNLFGDDAALTAAVLLSASGIFFLGCHNARPDILLALCLLGTLSGIAAFARTDSAWSITLAGVWAAAGLHVHANGLVLLPAILVFVVALCGMQRTFSLKVIAGLGAPIAIGMLLLCVVFAAAQPELVRGQILGHAGGHASERLSRINPLVFIPREFNRYLAWFVRTGRMTHVIEALTFVAAAIWGLCRGSRPVRALVAVWGAIFCLGGIVMMPWQWYLIYVWPILSTIVANAVMSPDWRRVGGPWLIVPTVAVALLQLGWWDHLARKQQPFTSTFDEIRAVIPADARVLGPGQFWFVFPEDRFTDTFFVEMAYHASRDQGLPVAARRDDFIAWADGRWDYIVADGSWRERLDPSVPLEPLVHSLHDGNGAYLLAEELRAFSEARCQVVARINADSSETLVLRVRQP